jgi:hypothetical protein
MNTASEREIAEALAAKGFRRALVIDSEYRQPWGERPTPHCIVARCAITGEEIRYWCGGNLWPPCPFALDGSELFIPWAADAEMGCFLQLGWPIPPYILDLFPEFLRMRNGHPREHIKNSLLDALAYFGEPAMGADEKDTMRQLAIRGAPFKAEEPRDLLDYCALDVDATFRLLKRMWFAARLDRPKIFAQALWRGRYMGAVAVMRAIGVPIDMTLLRRFEDYFLTHEDDLKAALIAKLGAPFGVYVGNSFNLRLFSQYLDRSGLLALWPRLDSGTLSLDKERFSEMAKLFPRLAPLHELRQTLKQLGRINFEIGQDGRNRVYLAPFRTKTSRNAPSNKGFIFGPSKAFRNLIRAPFGYGLASLDWSSQEIGVAAAIYHDDALWEACTSGEGDPYLAFGKKIGRIAPDVTTEQAKANPELNALRQAFKAVNLGILYGMSVFGLARRLQISEDEADTLMRQHRRLYPPFWKGALRAVDAAMLGEPLTTRLGWTLQYPVNSLAAASPRTAMNFPVQANAAEMMRYAAIRATEAGIAVCAPIHDCFLIEARSEAIRDEAERLRAIMSAAGEAILGPGYCIKAKPEIAEKHEFYRDERGREAFELLLREIDRIGASEGARRLLKILREEDKS